jgi:hypothetical protein
MAPLLLSEGVRGCGKPHRSITAQSWRKEMPEHRRRELTLGELEAEEALELPDRVELSIIPSFISAPALPGIPIDGGTALPAEPPPADPVPAPEAPPVQ